MNLSQEFVFRGVLKTLLLVASIPLPLSFIAGCRHKAVLAADVFAMPACLPAAVNEVELKPETCVRRRRDIPSAISGVRRMSTFAKMHSR